VRDPKECVLRFVYNTSGPYENKGVHVYLSGTGIIDVVKLVGGGENVLLAEEQRCWRVDEDEILNSDYSAGIKNGHEICKNEFSTAAATVADSLASVDRPGFSAGNSGRTCNRVTVVEWPGQFWRPAKRNVERLETFGRTFSSVGRMSSVTVRIVRVVLSPNNTSTGARTPNSAVLKIF